MLEGALGQVVEAIDGDGSPLVVSRGLTVGPRAEIGGSRLLHNLGIG